MRFSVLLACVLSFFCFEVGLGQAHASLASWKISCGVDKGAITKKGRTWVFKPSSNKCKSSYRQRSEIRSGDISVNRKGTYRFSTTVTINSASPQQFDIFQIHDHRRSCAPPLKLNVRPSGRLALDSEYRLSNGKCKKNGSLAGKSSSSALNLKGAAKKLDIDVAFDGKGGFGLAIYINGAKQITGNYSPPTGGNYSVSKSYYFKHGAYSRNRFDFTIESAGLKVRKIK